jgi:hypothetical protein
MSVSSRCRSSGAFSTCIAGFYKYFVPTGLRREPRALLPQPAPKYRLTEPTYNFQPPHVRVSCLQSAIN